MALFSFPTALRYAGWGGADEGQIRLFQPTPATASLESARSAPARHPTAVCVAVLLAAVIPKPPNAVRNREAHCGRDPGNRGFVGARGRKPLAATAVGRAIVGRMAGCGLGSAWLATATSGALLQPEREPSAVLGLRSVRCIDVGG
jgi:hypothetical protein